MTESELKRRIQLAIGSGDSRVWNNPVGEAWAGRLLSHKNGIARIQGAYRVTYGLSVGSPDLIGLVRRVITPDMVGRTVALFLGVEVKTATGRVRPEQVRFGSMLTDMGALYGVARSVEDAERLVRG